jgi:hypothetical protein
LEPTAAGRRQDAKDHSCFAVFFSLTVEMINLRVRKKSSKDAVELKPRMKGKD